jgi:hypothetical protein
MPAPVALVTVIQLTELVAVHVQLVPEVTDNALVLPKDGTLTLVGVTLDVHCASAVRTLTTKINAASRPQNRSVAVTRTSSRSGRTCCRKSTPRTLHI